MVKSASKGFIISLCSWERIFLMATITNNAIMIYAKQNAFADCIPFISPSSKTNGNRIISNTINSAVDISIICFIFCNVFIFFKLLAWNAIFYSCFCNVSLVRITSYNVCYTKLLRLNILSKETKCLAIELNRYSGFVAFLCRFFRPIDFSYNFV